MTTLTSKTVQSEIKDTISVTFASSSSIPKINLPHGGGTIPGIGEKFGANPVNRTASLSLPRSTSLGRSGFGPQLTLTYNSGCGNGPFGLGWNLYLPNITRKTDKGLPQYQDISESDVFILSDAKDLEPILQKYTHVHWLRETLPLRTVGHTQYRVERYCPRAEGLFALIERRTNLTVSNDIFWRSISKDNITT